MDLACQELVKLRADNAALTARVKELEDYARKATTAITGLSGGGSENFNNPIGDLYPADLPFCLERVRERYVSKVELKRIQTQLAAKDEELEAIMQAITDPENQPSQFGTVTVEYMGQQIAAITKTLEVKR
ncbi:hypothetical protein ACJKIH_14990 [Brucella pseudogrignonensis]|uniref:hypothetical protein n=1 Tax=Brucella pseudogrignonensis TaxID=419475 RepID=UPI0038B504D1